MKIKKSNRKGFTLIELLAVIVVLAIVLVVTIPAVLSSMKSARDKQFENAKSIVEKYVASQYEMCKNGIGDLAGDKYNASLFNSDCSLKEGIGEEILEGAGIDQDVIVPNTFEYEFNDGKFSITSAEPGSKLANGGNSSEEENEPQESDEDELSFIYFQESIAANYDSLTPVQKFQHDVNLVANYLNNQKRNEELGLSVDTEYTRWISKMSGFPTASGYEKADFVNKFCTEDDEKSLGSEILNKAGVATDYSHRKGINIVSCHSMAFLNNETNKICVSLKLNRYGWSYYDTSETDNDITTNGENKKVLTSSGCHS